MGLGPVLRVRFALRQTRPATYLLYALSLSAAGCDHPMARRETPPAISLTEILRIGGQQDTANLFNFINDVYVGENSNVYVTDNFDEGVRIFDPHGRFLRRFGEKGDGPGKINHPGQLAVHGDSVFLFGTREAQVFDTLGSWIGRKAFPSQLLIKDAVASHFGLLLYLSKVARRGPEELSVSIDACITAWADLPVLRLECKLHYSGASLYPFGAAGIRPLPFSAGGSVALSSSGVLYGSSGEFYEVDYVSSTGRGSWIGSAVPLPIRRKDVQEELDRIHTELVPYLSLWAEAGIETTGPAFKYPDAMDEYHPPKTRPVISEMIAGPNGDVLVRRVDLSDNDDDVWDLLNRHGIPTGRIVVDKEWKVEVRLLMGCSIYAIQRGEYDVESVVRYQFDPCVE